MSATLYLEHFGDADLELLAAASDRAHSAAELLSLLRAEPHYLEELLGAPSLFRALFAAGGSDALLHASPFLVFAVLVHRTTHDLAEANFVEEWIGPGRRVPMFEVSALRDFASDPLRRFFLAELLASYTRVASGSFLMHTPRGWRRRRFSELDPLRLVELLQIATESERPALYRRLGDVTLFLTGVFPDYAARRLFAPVERQRLQRILAESEESPALSGIEASAGDIWPLEQLGRRSYRVAWRATEAMGSGMARVLGEVAESFGQARRVLNFLTDRYLFPYRDRWFPLRDA